MTYSLENPFARIRRIRDSPVMGRLTRLQHHLLAAEVLGYTDTEVASGLEITRATVRRHRANLMNRILDPHGLPRQRRLLVTWFWCHQDGDAATARELIEKGKVFDRVDQPRRRDFA